jgi:hypothetical protein
MKLIASRRLAVLGATLALGIGGGVASPAQARAEVTTFTETHTSSFTGPSDFCLPEDQIGTVAITEVTTGQLTDTGHGVFQVHGVATFDVRQEFPDGTVVQSTKDRDLFSFRANGLHVVSHVVTLDKRPIYDAAGEKIGQITVHAVSQVSSYDLNDNGVLDPGEVKAEFEKFRVTCT